MAESTFTLLTTHQLRRGSEVALQRHFDSLVANSAGASIRCLLLVQRESVGDVLELDPPDFVEVLYGNFCSLSRARNILLELCSSRIGDDDIIAFPDDDAWYPHGALSAIRKTFEILGADYVGVRRSNNPSATGDTSRDKSRLDASSVVRLMSSNSIFIRGRVARDERYDERVGLGADFPGGEDTDISLRYLKRAEKAVWIDLPLVGHDDHKGVATPWARRRRYWQGDIYVLRKHTCNFPTLFLSLARKLFVGLALVVRRDMSFSQFVKPLVVPLGHATE